MSRLSVHVVYEHGTDLKPFGVAYIRELLPLSHPANEPFFRVSKGREYSRADVIIVERMWRPEVTIGVAEKLVEWARRDGVCIIYSIDDNLLDLKNVPAEARRVIRYFCRQADGIIVSTSYLKERLAHLNPRIFCVPNAIDESLYFPPEISHQPVVVQKDKKVVGYMGTLTHDADLMMALQALRQVLRKYRYKIEFQIVGGISSPAILKALEGLPVKVLSVPVQDVAYPNFVAWMKKNLNWDLAIAPLEDSYFNRFKSDIKFLDYSALGIAGIYSQVPSYTQTVQHLATGYLAANKPAEWVTGLEQLLNDDALREQLARNAQQFVAANRTLQHCAQNWRTAIEAIVNRA